MDVIEDLGQRGRSAMRLPKAGLKEDIKLLSSMIKQKFFRDF
jgi:hypothetical protein